VPVILKSELKTLGCDLEPEDFRDLLLELQQVMYPDWTDEELKNHPAEAQTYCRAVRHRTVPAMPDHLILRTLTNIRKRPD
jgi:hypothetical protein